MQVHIYSILYMLTLISRSGVLKFLSVIVGRMVWVHFLVPALTSWCGDPGSDLHCYDGGLGRPAPNLPGE